ncbi:MAG: HEAT repeat domain-containing protein [Myxococcota bacterium]|nr:HEAT repeat domain-containing protein [Myxococcota bacterium]MDW8360896.1 HEAT repeat domain-containing protein [Myxococcales bacterium]
MTRPCLPSSAPSVLLGLLVALATLTANAQPRSGRRPARDPRAAAVRAEIEAILPKLRSASPDEVREGIDLLSALDRPEVVPHLVETLRAGQPDAVTDRALEALGALAHPGAIEALTVFTHHRRPGARLRAYRALAAISDPRVPSLLERGLSDSDRSVRAAAAVALGDIGARGSLDVLFRAFERGVVEAAIAIGKLGDARAVERFGEHLGRRPLGVMLSGYGEFLRRTDLPEAVKLQIVARLTEVSGPMVRRFFEELLATLPERGGRLRTEVETAIRRIPPGPAPSSASTPPTGGAS